MLDAVQLFHSEVAMNALFASLAWCLARPNRASILSAGLCAVIWPFVNKPLEGHILMVLRPEHGITTSDMLSVFAAIVVAAQIGRRHRARTRDNRTPAPCRGQVPTQSPAVQFDLEESLTHPTVPLHHPAGPVTHRRARPASAPTLRHATTRPPQHYSHRRLVHQQHFADTTSAG